MEPIRMVAVDLDGTLLRGDTSISERDREAIRNTQAAGVRVVIATGRMYSTALPYARALAVDTPLVLFNGAYITDLEKKRIWAHYRFDTRYARRIREEARRRGLHLNYYVEDDINVEECNDLVRGYLHRMETEVRVVPDMEGFFRSHPRLTKITVQCLDCGKIDEFARWLADTWPEELYIVKSHPLFLEISNPHATKGTGVRRVAEMLGVPAGAVMGIGDNHNDRCMLEYAGLGVAMGNAEEEIKAVADYVTASHEEDGVARALERFVLGGSS